MPIYSDSTVAKQPIIDMPFKEMFEASRGAEGEFTQGINDKAQEEAKTAGLYSPIVKDNEELKNYQQKINGQLEDFKNANWLDPNTKNKWATTKAGIAQQFQPNGEIGQLLQSKEEYLKDYKEAISQAGKAGNWDANTINKYYNLIAGDPNEGHNTKIDGIYTPKGLPPKPEYDKEIGFIQDKATPDIVQGAIQTVKSVEGNELDKIPKVKQLTENKLLYNTLDELNNNSAVRRAADFDGKINKNGYSSQIYKLDPDNPNQYLIDRTTGLKVPNWDNPLVQTASAKAHSKAYSEDISEYKDLPSKIGEEKLPVTTINSDQLIATPSAINELDIPESLKTSLNMKNHDIIRYSLKDKSGNNDPVELVNYDGSTTSVKHPDVIWDKTDKQWVIYGKSLKGTGNYKYIDPDKKPGDEGYESDERTPTNTSKQYEHYDEKPMLFPVKGNHGAIATHYNNILPPGFSNGSTPEVSNERVNVIGPDGKEYTLPKGQLDEAQKQGYKVKK